MRHAGLARSKAGLVHRDGLANGGRAVIDDKVKIRCPGCTRMFRERASRVRDGFQINCQNCSKLLTLNRDSEDPFIRRALRTAREVRAALEAVPVATRVDASARSM
jgi:hypothetical protein